MATTDMQMTVTQAPGANLIVNSGFETDATGWESTTAFGAYTAATLTRSTVRAKAGTASLFTTWPTGPASIANAYPITTVVGVTYTFTAWVYVPAGSPDVRLNMIFFQAGAVTSVKGAWVPLTLTFTATVAGNMWPGIETVTAPTAGQQCFIDEAFFKASLMVIADGADTPCPAAVTDAAVYAVGDRVQATIRTPQMPLITAKVSAE